MASMIECWLIPLIEAHSTFRLTLDQHLHQYSMLYQHLNLQSVESQQIFADATLSVDLWYISLNQLTLGKLSTNCQLSVDQVLIEILIKVVLTEFWDNDWELIEMLVHDWICVHLTTKIGCKYLPHADGTVTTEGHVNCVNMQCTGVFDTVASNPQTKALCQISSNIYLHWIL